MAVPDAVRRSGSLLLRALAVGGLATAAWLACAGAASAEEHPADAADLSFPDPSTPHGDPATGPRAPSTTDTVADLVAEAVLTGHQAQTTPRFPPAQLHSAQFSAAPFPADQFSTDFPADLFSADLLPADLLPSTLPEREPAVIFEIPPLAFGPRPVEETAGVGQVLASEPFFADDAFSEDDLSYAGGYSTSGHSHSGSATNTMPEPLYEAKLAAKAAARAAAEAAPPAQSPPPAPAATPAPTSSPLPFTTPFPTAPAPDTKTTGTAGVTWEAPKNHAPAPAPKQAPAPSAPTASSSSADNGGGHRGGPTASLTAQSNVERATAWSVERRDDGRSPGSVPGLPSTSPD